MDAGKEGDKESISSDDCEKDDTSVRVISYGPGSNIVRNFMHIISFFDQNIVAYKE